MKNNIKIVKGKEQFVTPRLENMIFENYPIKEGEEQDINIQIECENMLESPVYEGKQIGTVKVLLGKENIIELNLTIPYTIYKKEPIDYWYEIWRRWKWGHEKW